MKFKNRLYSAFLLVLISLFGNAIFAQSRMLTDENITEKVSSEMFWQLDVPANQIDVATNEGITTLTGTVNSILGKERAAKVAMATKGVKGVINNIEVNPPYISDEELREDIENALQDDPATEVYEVNVVVEDGAVTLGGNVDSWQEKQLSAYVAKDVKGVKSIENHIDVSYNSNRSDNEIRQEIETAIKNDIRLYPKLMQINVKNGVVGLSGSVGSLNEKLLAESYAWTTGVSAVSTDGLHVHDWAGNENLREQQYPSRTDAEIKTAVKNAFFYDARVNSFTPKIKVNNGIVTLSGEVSSLIAKQAAKADAKNVVGVSYVKNNLKVRPSEIPTESTIIRQVSNALMRNPDVERYQIDVKAWQGKVYLDGTVDTYFEKYKAHDVASSIKGVIEVVNNLEVYKSSGVESYYPDITSYYPSPYISPENYYEQDLTDKQIEESISDELWWSPFVNEYQVEVEVNEGIATLTGTVDNWRERKAAAENAREGGAEAVINDLEVKNNNDNKY